MAARSCVALSSHVFQLALTEICSMISRYALIGSRDLPTYLLRQSGNSLQRKEKENTFAREYIG